MKLRSFNGFYVTKDRQRPLFNALSIICLLLVAILAVIKKDVEYKQNKYVQSIQKATTPSEEAASRINGIPIVWILGGPGSGKGTQCEKIIQKYGFTHLSTGDLLRSEITSGSSQGKELTAIMERGELVPMGIVMKLLKDAIINAASNPATTGFLIDGYPREKQQGVLFEQEIRPCNLILYFEVADETMTKRLLGRAISSGRADDNPETIKLRLQTFSKNNNEILEHFIEKLVKINAESDIDSIFSEVAENFDRMLQIFQQNGTS